MAVKKIPVPFCDWCEQPFLPKFRLKDGTRNPIFDHPEKSKRCGKCKRTGWNAGGVDRRRKNTITVIADPEDGPFVSTIKEQLDVDIPIENPRTQVLIKNLQPVTARPQAPVEARKTTRCRHNLYKCPQCHPEEAA